MPSNTEQAQIDAINAQGQALLREARELLSYFEGMPEHLIDQQAHDAANALRGPKSIISELESSFVDEFKSFASTVRSARDEHTFKDAISRASAVVTDYRAQLNALPTREREA